MCKFQRWVIPKVSLIKLRVVDRLYWQATARKMKAFLTLALSYFALTGFFVMADENKPGIPEDSITISQPSFSGGQWQNPPTFSYRQPSALRFFKFMMFERTAPKLPTPEELEQAWPMKTPDFTTESNETLQVTWIGHATALVQMAGISFLTDPMWSERCSPVSFTGPKRFRPPPISIDELPNLDFVVISHNHYDHLDYDTVRALNKRYKPDIHWFVPMGLKSWMESSGCSNVHELNWDQAEQFSWLVSSLSTRVFFAGDSGFCEDEYRKIGQKYGPFDLAALPIGCYEPKHIMSSQHMSVDDAVQVHNLLRANNSLGIHWATFPMGSTEPILEPGQRLAELAAQLRPNTNFRATSPGETWRIR